MSNKEVIDEVCEKGYRLPKPTIIQMPDDIYELMQQMWSLDPDKRPQFDKICTELRKIRVAYGFEPTEIIKPPTRNSVHANYSEGNKALTSDNPSTDAKNENYQGMDIKDEDENYQS